MMKVVARLFAISPLISVALINPSSALTSNNNLDLANLVKTEKLKLEPEPNSELKTQIGSAVSLSNFIADPSSAPEPIFAQSTPIPAIPPELIQPNPNQQRFPQPSDTPQPVTPETETPTPPVETPLPPGSGNRRFDVEEIQVTGSSIFDAAKFAPFTEPLKGRNVSLRQLQDVADQITQVYLEGGYVTTRAIVVAPPEGAREIEIRVIEGSLEEIQIQGTQRLNDGFVRSRIEIGAGVPLNTAKLEDQLRLLRINPLFENIEASLRAGNSVGKSILLVRVQEANPLGGSIGIDNYSPPSVGSERLTANLFYRNLTGHGDGLFASATRTTAGDTYTLDLSYRIPINSMDGTIETRARVNRNEVIQEPFDVLEIRGESELYEISYRQPLVRNPREELALSVGFAYQEGQTFTFAGATPFGFGPNEEGISRTSVFKFAQEYVRRDVSGAWAFRSLMNFGVDIFDATNNSGDIPDGQFFSWLGQIQRVQVINPDNLLIIQADVQLAPEPLLPAQQFVVGGGQSVRGYRQNVRAADNGFRFSVEDRITLVRSESGAPYFQVAPFFDAGYVWNNSQNPNFIQDQRFIAGLGTGLLWQPLPGLNVKLDWAFPLIDLDDRGNNAQDDGFYFSVNYRF